VRRELHNSSTSTSWETGTLAVLCILQTLLGQYYLTTHRFFLFWIKDLLMHRTGFSYMKQTAKLLTCHKSEKTNNFLPVSFDVMDEKNLLKTQ